MFVSVHVYTCACVWKPGYLPLLLPSSLPPFDAGSLPKLELSYCLNWIDSNFQEHTYLQPQGYECVSPCLAFMSGRDPNSGSHAFSTGIVLTKPSP